LGYGTTNRIERGDLQEKTIKNWILEERSALHVDSNAVLLLFVLSNPVSCPVSKEVSPFV
jgi:hypothetical protein